MLKIIKITLFLTLCKCWSSGLLAQETPTVIPLWEKGAPGFESRKNEPEQAKDWWVRNVHHPSLTIYTPPKEKANGTAIVVCPGGGHRNLVFNSEGRDAATFLANLGITVFVLKYRLFREENSPYKMENAIQDGYRAMRLVRSRAKEWQLDTARIGIMGFSAGGELAGWVAFGQPDAYGIAKDAIDRVSARPNFHVSIYPGPLAVPATLTASAPPAFLLAANDDECCSEPILQMAQLYRKAKVPVEIHLYDQGSHGFNMGLRSNMTSVKTWPQRLQDWLSENGWLEKKP